MVVVVQQDAQHPQGLVRVQVCVHRTHFQRTGFGVGALKCTLNLGPNPFPNALNMDLNGAWDPGCLHLKLRILNVRRRLHLKGLRLNLPGNKNYEFP